MPVKLLRCLGQWVKVAGHPYWRVEKALIDMGIEYETHVGAAMPWQREKRSELIEKTGGNRYPAIEFEDGSVYAMDETIRAGTRTELQAGQDLAPDFLVNAEATPDSFPPAHGTRPTAAANPQSRFIFPPRLVVSVGA